MKILTLENYEPQFNIVKILCNEIEIENGLIPTIAYKQI